MTVKSLAFSQHMVLAPDSSQLIFRNNVAVSFRPTGDGKHLLISRKSFQIVWVQCNYLYELIDLARESAELYKREVKVRDSVIRVLEKEAIVSNQRLNVYAEAYGQANVIAEAYDKQTRSIIDETSKLQKLNRKSKRKSFVKGIATGVVAAVIIGLFSDFSH